MSAVCAGDDILLGSLLTYYMKLREQIDPGAVCCAMGTFKEGGDGDGDGDGDFR